MQKFSIEYHTKSGELFPLIPQEEFLRNLPSLDLECAHLMYEDGEYIGAIHNLRQMNTSKFLRSLYKT